MIQEMKKKGMSITQIAKELGRDRKTIRKWLKEGEPGSYTRKELPKSKLDPYKDYVLQRMKEGCFNAMVLMDELATQGYKGKITLLRNFMHPYREATQSQATVRFETLPGKQAQVDWGEFTVKWDKAKKKLHAFVMVLGYSRMIYLEFMENEKEETLIRCHERAMEYFGGCTETCLYDNMKTVVIGLDSEGHVVWNQKFADFATHHGFILKRCQPRRPQTKGKVENGVGYIKKNFWPRVRCFTSLSDLNIQARAWMDQTANVRIHGTTHERPVDRWKDEGLRPANPIPYPILERTPCKVSRDALVSYQASRYSVPFHYVGQIVHIQDDQNGTLRIYSGDQQITQHEKAVSKYQMIAQPMHYEGISSIPKGPNVPWTPSLTSEKHPEEVAVRSLNVYEDLAQEEGTQ